MRGGRCKGCECKAPHQKGVTNEVETGLTPKGVRTPFPWKKVPLELLENKFYLKFFKYKLLLWQYQKKELQNQEKILENFSGR